MTQFQTLIPFTVFNRVTLEACTGLAGKILIGRSQTMVSTDTVAGPRHVDVSSGFVGLSGSLIGSVDVTNSK